MGQSNHPNESYKDEIAKRESEGEMPEDSTPADEGVVIIVIEVDTGEDGEAEDGEAEDGEADYKSPGI